MFDTQRLIDLEFWQIQGIAAALVEDMLPNYVLFSDLADFGNPG